MSNVYFGITLPHRDPCLLGVETDPNCRIIETNHDTETSEEKWVSIVSIGLIFFRIDIIFNL